MTVALTTHPPRWTDYFRHHFQWYARQRPLPFLFAVSAEGLAASVLTVLFLHSIFHGPSRSDLNLPPSDFFLTACIFAPLWETFLYQLLPFAILDSLRAPLWFIITVSAVWFTDAHFGAGLETAISAGAVGGVYFAFTLAHWRQTRGYTMAYALTAASHCLHNFTLFVILLCLGNFNAPTFDTISRPNLDMVYITNFDHSFAAAITAEKITGVFDASGNQLYGPVRLLTVSGAHSIELQNQFITIDKNRFNLSQGRYFYLNLEPRRFVQTIQQFEIPTDAAQFSKDPVATMQTNLQKLAVALAPTTTFPQ